MPLLSLRIFSPAFLCLASVFLLTGCSSRHLITGEPPAAIRTAGNEENRAQLYERTYRYLPGGRLVSLTHEITRVGAHGTESGLGVFDGSMERLTAFEARVIFAGGSVDWYDKSDLGTVSLKTSAVISERSFRSVRLKNVPRPGDLIETAYEHDIALPQLGVHFSIAEAGSGSGNISCVFEVPSGDTLLFQVLNDSLAPSIVHRQQSTEYRFHWDSWTNPVQKSVFRKVNDSPGILAIVPGRGPSSWRAFGDWYLDLIEGKTRTDDAIGAAARELLKAGMTTREKMNAIVDYCQDHVRYEQVYIERGEYIPNDATTVFARKFGDCKDCSVLIAGMARAAGLDAKLALCHRGTSYDMSGELPVARFNHMIVYLHDGDTDYWYDGTNPSGAPGVTASDLVNGTALILERGASRMTTIGESRDNLFSVTGTLHPKGDALTGHLKIRLASQYAIGFLALEGYANERVMKEALTGWLEEDLATRIRVSEPRWRRDGQAFEVDVACEFPNALWKIEALTYVTFDKVFDRLMPREDPSRTPGAVYHYPSYARVALAIDLPDFKAAAGDAPLRWEVQYALPPGPFTGSTRGGFLENYRMAKARLTETVKLSRKD